ncbi:MAG: hypothetical protein ACLRWP_05700 [Bilophila wadsworthia]
MGNVHVRPSAGHPCRAYRTACSETSAALPSFEAASFSRHATPPIAAVSKDRAFEAQCVCPKPFADRENYALVENGKPLGVS